MSEKSFEDTVSKFLTGDVQKNALDFAAYLRENEITLEENEGVWVCDGAWDVIWVGTSNVSWVGADEPMPGSWTIFHSGYDHTKYDPDNIPTGKDGDKIGLCDLSADERLKEVAWEHVKPCFHFTSNGKECGCGKQPGRRTTVFGKEFDNVCSATLQFINPDAETLEYVKKLMKLMKLGMLKSNACSL